MSPATTATNIRPPILDAPGEELLGASAEAATRVVSRHSGRHVEYRCSHCDGLVTAGQLGSMDGPLYGKCPYCGVALSIAEAKAHQFAHELKSKMKDARTRTPEALVHQAKRAPRWRPAWQELDRALENLKEVGAKAIPDQVRRDVARYSHVTCRIPGRGPASLDVGLRWLRSSILDGFLVDYEVRGFENAATVWFKRWKPREPEPEWEALIQD